MRFLFNIIKNIIAVGCIIVIVFFALKYAPFLKEQEWNPISNKTTYSSYQGGNVPIEDFKPGQRYVVEKNDILNNMPASQTKNIFNMLNKEEFMDVSGLSRMGYNENYLIGQRGNQFIMYKFGSDELRIYATEIELHQDLQAMQQNIQMHPVAYFK
ncbi:DUF4930 family protein [Staphylococcus simulans]|uniref:Membrane protein n=2 Tax=Staphylococcus simulans TaxID=1286 RepID=A0ABP2YR13_STASI|nr:MULTISPECIES: DUF4930 family protein [Staphylococcus]AMG95928.1 DUF4930 domain-containing protein [Staphylococcus simulans]ATF31856.1 DUF4930 domain-containing protein [Staphylococcus simulans]EKS24583.1 hypothetical protein HMPREF9310_01643 [Staphylococcus simulans ACS-120-V-Sch1]ERS92581.1 membrane protein [Staphylococcus simulans UMC-CNS-990]KXA41087.1 hypothetical protein HMPREF3215_02506 [Staphylococcus simulans]